MICWFLSCGLLDKTSLFSTFVTLLLLKSTKKTSSFLCSKMILFKSNTVRPIFGSFTEKAFAGTRMKEVDSSDTTSQLWFSSRSTKTWSTCWLCCRLERCNTQLFRIVLGNYRFYIGWSKSCCWATTGHFSTSTMTWTRSLVNSSTSTSTRYAWSVLSCLARLVENEWVCPSLVRWQAKMKMSLKH